MGWIGGDAAQGRITKQTKTETESARTAMPMSEKALMAKLAAIEAERDKLVEAANGIFDNNDDYDDDRLLVSQDDANYLYECIPCHLRTPIDAALEPKAGAKEIDLDRT